MIGILIASLMMFGLAQAENRAEKSEEKDEVSSSSSEESSKEERDKKAKEDKAAERFRAQQSIQRALRDQGQAHGPIAPTTPAQPPTKSK
ncbi:hypothetical protein AZI86_18625 [Bdellovibrio bacteriovorus]|uniref:Uncharacterized protein n=1 Tax=Bdellovibrio bacteriovorus TaxID=959 RepID=A0A150WF95_BDEBC|nr:hypothetical protein [Bdellovibrio bacteriovorus]KYG61706.1 hypothetical protein AZI86_18625 [Bdellovibrio bacteriovorus]